MDVKVADAVKKHFKATDIAISQTGGSRKWQCLACEKVITGSATKLRAHLLGISGHNVAPCKEVCEGVQNAIREVEAENPHTKAREPARSLGLSSRGGGSRVDKAQGS